MTTVAVASPTVRALKPSSQRLLRSAMRLRRTRLGLGITLLLLFAAIFGPYIAPHGPNNFVGIPFAPPGNGALFGTDDLGQDVTSRFLFGGRSILELASLATLIGVGMGTLIGLSAAYARNALDDILMRAMDILLAIPDIMLALVVMATVGTQWWLIVMTVGVATMPRVARVIRGAALQVVERDFVASAAALGESRLRILAFEVVPNVTGTLVVETTIRMTYAVGLIASLAFLGFTASLNSADWGLMIEENQIALTVQPWGTLLPVFAIALLTIGMGLVGDGLARASSGLDR